ncbi:uncharacterized protein LOC123014897 [Tribolium madens]|uniref:uncharacterized protein LOC123014897 n=1 Tax=Tribolium madens TaxID=41895 RepID=UPI001CF721C1|nr:uncharacterized protein LOC123014897 [Tribolium madens]
MLNFCQKSICLIFVLNFISVFGYGLKCFHCSYNFHTSDENIKNKDQGPQTIDCDHPSQIQCEAMVSNCIKIIDKYAMLQTCFSLNDPNARHYFNRCDHVRKINPENCKICKTKLCNSDTRLPISATLPLLCVIALFLG